MCRYSHITGKYIETKNKSHLSDKATTKADLSIYNYVGFFFHFKTQINILLKALK